MDRRIGNNSYSVILSNHNTITGNCSDESKKGSIDNSRASASRRNYNNNHHHNDAIESNIAMGDFCALSFEKQPSKITVKHLTDLAGCTCCPAEELGTTTTVRHSSPPAVEAHDELLLHPAAPIAPPSSLVLETDASYADESALLASSTRQPEHHHVSETFSVEDDEQFLVQTSVKQEKNV